jgi:hypothetical protein
LLVKWRQIAKKGKDQPLSSKNYKNWGEKGITDVDL